MAELNVQGSTLQHLGGIETTADVINNMGQQGYMTPARASGPAHQRRVIEAARLMAGVMQGTEDPYFMRQALNPTNAHAVAYLQEKYPGIYGNVYSDRSVVGLRETMSYSDYSALTVDILDRMLYGYYSVAQITNKPLVKIQSLRDFRVVARYATDKARKPWSRMPDQDGNALVPSGAGEPFTERAIQQAAREVLGSTQRVTYQPQMYQGGMAVNWRAFVNDDLGIFQDNTAALADGGARTIYKYITSLYVASTGPNTTLYSSTFSNLVTTTYGAATNNPALSFQGLIDAVTVLERQRDIDGDPITFSGQLYLVVGPSLKTTADALVNAQQADISVGGGTTNTQGFPSQRLRVATNYVVRNMQVIEDKYMPIVCTTSGIQNTMWFLFYAPSGQNRPALELGFLKGFEEPQLFSKVPNTMRVGGGLVPEMGDFYSMDQEWKGVLVMGGTQIDGRSTVASTGAGV